MHVIRMHGTHLEDVAGPGVEERPHESRRSKGEQAERARVGNAAASVVGHARLGEHVSLGRQKTRQETYLRVVAEQSVTSMLSSVTVAAVSGVGVSSAAGDWVGGMGSRNSHLSRKRVEAVRCE